MRKTVLLLLALSFLAGCRPHDDYTGEPCIHMEYTVDGEHYVYEDWGHIAPGYILSSGRFEPDSEGGLSSKSAGEGQSTACFDLRSNGIQLRLESPQSFFVDGRQYQYKQDPQKQGLDLCVLYKPEKAAMTEGRYSFSRKCSEPYCRYEVRFEFTCQGEQRTFEITDGIIQVGRRFQADIKSLIKSPDEL